MVVAFTTIVVQYLETNIVYALGGKYIVRLVVMVFVATCTTMYMVFTNKTKNCNS